MTKFLFSLRVLLPLAILVATWFAIKYLQENKPEVKKARPRSVVVQVETQTFTRENESFTIKTYGTVSSRSNATLIAESAGRIVKLGAGFVRAGQFRQGDLLLKIDDREHLAAVNAAKSELAKARALYAEERARAKQAKEDWQRLGFKNAANPLALRTPQTASAKAAEQSALANLSRQRINYERTTIKAPYNGRIIDVLIDVGQYVNKGAVLAKIIATDYVEVRLPLNQNDLAFLRLPETDQDPAVAITLSGLVRGASATWPARIVRSEPVLDAITNQHWVIARIDGPYDSTTNPLKVGQFVTAEIPTIELKSIVKIPTNALLDNNTIMLAENGQVKTQVVSPRYQSDDWVWLNTEQSSLNVIVNSPLLAEGTQIKQIKQVPATEREDMIIIRDQTANRTRTSSATAPTTTN